MHAMIDPRLLAPKAACLPAFPWPLLHKETMRVQAALAALTAALLLARPPSATASTGPSPSAPYALRKQGDPSEPTASSASLPQPGAPVADAGGGSAGAAQQGVAGVGPWGEWIPKNATQAVSCGLAGVSQYFTIHLAGVNLTAHPDACGR
jgi:hypothetical protein